MREGPLAQPRGRRRRRVRRRLPWRAVLVALLGLATVAGVAMLARRADRTDPAAAFARGEASLRAGNISAARNHFLRAVEARPTDGRAQAELARAYLLLGDGVAAGGALDRAVAAGVAPERLRPWRAAALLLQDDAAGALAEARRAGTDAYARRVAARATAAAGDRAGAAAMLAALAAERPGDAGAWTDLARVRLDLGDVGAASLAAARATALDPRDLAALTLRGEIVRRRNGLIAALPWFDAALAHDAYYVPALIERAATLGDSGRATDSLADLRKVLAARPGQPRALYLLAVIAARAGNGGLAAALLDRAGDLGDMPAALLLAGVLDERAGRHEQAVVRWRALLDRQPMNLVARRLLGAAMLRSGDASEALATLRPIALRADADPYSLTLVARAFEARGERGWAAAFLDRAARAPAGAATPFGQDESAAVLAGAVADAPGDPRVAVARIRGMLEAGQGSVALAAAQRLSAASPGAPAAWQLLGDVQAATQRPAAALPAYLRAADLRFDRPAMLRLIEARVASGDPRGAADTLALYLSQNPASPDARRALANLQLAAGQAGSAVATLEGLHADLGHRDARLLTQLAAAYTAAGDPGTALPYARAAVRLQPMNAAAVDALGHALFDRGDTGAALPLLTKAVALAPREGAIRWHQAQALADAGRTAEATVAIAAALADPVFGERAAALRLRQVIAR